MVDLGSNPNVYTIILNWNQGRFTLDCLESLEQSSYPNNTIVVVDNGSNDGSPELIEQKYSDIVLLRQTENLGFCEGNNVGIRFALENNADYVFLLNNDTLVDPSMLSELIDVAESDQRIGMVGPTIFYIEPPKMIWGGENRINWLKAETVRKNMGELVDEVELKEVAPYETDYIDTCSALIKRDVVAKIGTLNNNYFINFDDIEMGVRIRKAGYRVIYVPGAFMWHRVSAAMGVDSPASAYYMTRNSLLFFWSYATGVWKLLSVLQILLRDFRTITAWTFKGKYQNERFRRKRAAKLLALRDFFLRRYGKMGSDVMRACYS